MFDFANHCLQKVTLLESECVRQYLGIARVDDEDEVVDFS